MPWTAKDATRFNKDIPEHLKDTWAKVANDALQRCKENGGSDCEGQAIRTANRVIKKIMNKSVKQGVDMKVNFDDEQTLVMSDRYSDYPDWGSVDKTKLPKEAFLIVGDPEKKSTWKFPIKYYRNGKLVVHPGAVKAAWAYRRYIKNPSKLAYLRSLYQKYWGKTKE